MPKNVIDGCFPSYSYENYLSRAPCKSTGRTVCLLLAQIITERFPGLGEKILLGADQMMLKKSTEKDFFLKKTHSSYKKFLEFLNGSSTMNVNEGNLL